MKLTGTIALKVFPQMGPILGDENVWEALNWYRLKKSSSIQIPTKNNTITFILFSTLFCLNEYVSADAYADYL